MRFVKSEHPPGVVGVISGSTPRFYEFHDSLEWTEVPEGTKLFRAFSCNPANNCNSIMRQMPPEAQWLWILGDDHDWDQGLLMRLLDRNVDLIVPMVARRVPPWLPVVYNAYKPALDGLPHTDTRGYPWQALHEGAKYDGGLLPINAAGSAGLLIRRPVWEAVEAAYGDPIWRVGTSGPDSMCEDLDFTHKAARMGFGCYVDCNEAMGHLVPVSIFPEREEDGQLVVKARFYEGRRIPLVRTHETQEQELTVQPKPRLEVIK